MNTRFRKVNPFLLFGEPARTMREVEQDGQDALDTLDQLEDVNDPELDQDLIHAFMPDCDRED